MALSSAKHEKFYATSGGGADQVRSEELTNITAAWASEKAEGCKKYVADPVLGPIIYQLQQMQDEIDYLRTEISDNKDKTGITTDQANAITANTAKTSMVLGTTNKTALAGNTTTISTAQANAIIANTAKTSMTLGTSSNTALAGDTNIVTIGSNTTIAFGDMVSTTKKGVTTYSIVMTVTNGGVSKTITHTLT